MGKYLLKRLGQSIIAILGITVVVFFILHLTGNPVELMVSPTTSKEEMEILSEEMGFNDPLPVQYVRFLKGALVGDFGTSYYYNEPAMSVVLERAPATLTLACAALLISVVLGIPAGIVAAVKRNSVSDAVIRVLALLGQCMPALLAGHHAHHALCCEAGLDAHWRRRGWPAFPDPARLHAGGLFRGHHLPAPAQQPHRGAGQGVYRCGKGPRVFPKARSSASMP